MSETQRSGSLLMTWDVRKLLAIQETSANFYGEIVSLINTYNSPEPTTPSTTILFVSVYSVVSG